MLIRPTAVLKLVVRCIVRCYNSSCLKCVTFLDNNIIMPCYEIIVL